MKGNSCPKWQRLLQAGILNQQRECNDMKTLLALLIMICLVSAAAAQTQMPKTMVKLYVSLQGNDAWTGRLPVPNHARDDGPLATVAMARDRVRTLRKQGVLVGKRVTVQIRGGVYFLTEPLVLTAEDSGTPSAPVVYEAYQSEQPVISGGRRFRDWTTTPEGLWVTHVQGKNLETPYFSQLFEVGRRLPRTSLPVGGGYYTIADAVPSTQPKKGADGFQYAPGDINPSWQNREDVNILCYHIWNMSRLRIASIDAAAHVVRFTGTTSAPDFWANLAKGGRFRVENVFEALPFEPGAWYLDRSLGKLYYHPMPGDNLKTFAPVAPMLTQLVRIDGSHDVTLRGLSFQHADWTLAPEGYSCVQAEVAQPAVITAVNARNCRLGGCEVAHVGTYAVEWGKGCRGNALIGCRLHDLGAGGVKIGSGGIPATRDEMAGGNVVDQCRIYDAGQVHPAAVGVWIGQSPGNRITHNDIHDLYYTGISVGWSWGYGPARAQNTTVAYNHIYNIGLGVLSDMGGIYTLGNQRGSRLDHNLIHDVLSYSYGSWGIYPDEGTTGLQVTNNVVYGCKTGGFHQNYGKDNMIENNVFALNTWSQVEASVPEDHRSYTFAHNIVYWNQGELFVGNWPVGKVDFDYNVYWNAKGPVHFPNGSLTAWQQSGRGLHSIVADPLFVAPLAHDFTLSPNSPALALGFKPIDLSTVGAK